MAQRYDRLQIEINEPILSIVTAIQNDTNSRYLDVSLYDGGVPIPLTGNTVRIHTKNIHGVTSFEQGEITDADNGRCQFLLTTQMLSAADALETQISIWSGDQQVLSTQKFQIYVMPTLRDDTAVESTNEYGALVVLFSEIQNALDDMHAIRENFGKPSEESIQAGTDTFWKVLEKSVEGTNELFYYNIPKKLGEPDDVIQALTVFGKLNWIKNFLESSVAGVTIFETPGKHTFKVPAGTTEIVVTACGGGGGGAGSNVSTGNDSDCAGGGGGGAAVVEKKLNVTPGQTINITVANGGAGGSPGNNGSAGEATVIGELLTLAGGGGGISSTNKSSAIGGTSGGNGGGKGGDSGTDGSDGIIGRGGVFDKPDTFEGHKRGGGGGGSLGDGGNVPYDGNGKNGVLGGGGSGASTPYANRSYTGGKGGNGYVKINVGGVPE
ncbi:BppU family phage baseplate upper protein [Anaerotignum lactatifermentans]|uniref:BppU family phage baseplate upper protein n=1 Tax=Anaerotignum lactatifermentans TaxID=160404 RepID=UPI00255CFDB9|nr:BppU family phage baseplate upper protein [Anaerotignum lactatifermentans]